jgi:hypothetical protein
LDKAARQARADFAEYWHLKGDVPEFKDYLRAGPDLDEPG